VLTDEDASVQANHNWVGDIGLQHRILKGDIAAAISSYYFCQ